MNTDYFIEPLRKYATFSGRARRTELWYFALYSVLILLVLSLIDDSGVLGGIFHLAILIPSLAVGARRLHDTNRSGWWLLIALVPIIGGIALLVFYAQDGDKGSNQYGEDPKGFPSQSNPSSGETPQTSQRSDERAVQSNVPAKEPFSTQALKDEVAQYEAEQKNIQQ
jgi:uncharacterized membrane protein YhaH (DUF805 family)